jgi:uncharacterized membrane protein
VAQADRAGSRIHLLYQRRHPALHQNRVLSQNHAALRSWHLAMVQISGVCEVLGGLGLLIPAVRRAAAWGLVALLIAVFPANIYMVTDPVAAGAASLSPLVLWGRLPLQLVFIAWVLWATQPAIVPANGRAATS